MVLKIKEGHGWTLYHNDRRKSRTVRSPWWWAPNNSLAKVKGLSSMLGIAEAGVMITQAIFVILNTPNHYGLTR